MISSTIFDQSPVHTPKKKTIRQGLLQTSTASTNYTINSSIDTVNKSLKSSINAFDFDKELNSSLKKEDRWDRKTNRTDDKKKSKTDRFIPLRSSSKLHLAFSNLHEEVISDNQSKPNLSEEDSNPTILTEYLRSEVLGFPPQQNRFVNKNLFRYSDGCDENSPQSFFDDSSFSLTTPMGSGVSKFRKISKTPSKILDAPAL